VQKTFSERLEAALQGESLHSFSKRSGIGDSTLRKYLEGSEPGMDKLLRIADTAGVTLDWLVAERGPMRMGEEESMKTSGKVLSLPDTSDAVTLVPRLEIEASAGFGSLSELEQAVEFVAFQEAWLRSIGVNPPFARLLTARGDSMEKTIRDGDFLLVDTSFAEVRDNGLYCVVYGNLLLVKRVHVRLDSSLQLISDNPLYPPEEVSPGMKENLTIAGRVMWFGRTI
jgi:phage repressor protein C with HTH and peptisase S24 domain